MEEKLGKTRFSTAIHPIYESLDLNRFLFFHDDIEKRHFLFSFIKMSWTTTKNKDARRERVKLNTRITCIFLISRAQECYNELFHVKLKLGIMTEYSKTRKILAESTQKLKHSFERKFRMRIGLRIRNLVLSNTASRLSRITGLRFRQSYTLP